MGGPGGGLPLYDASRECISPPQRSWGGPWALGQPPKVILCQNEVSRWNESLLVRLLVRLARLLANISPTTGKTTGNVS